MNSLLGLITILALIFDGYLLLRIMKRNRLAFLVAVTLGLIWLALATAKNSSRGVLHYDVNWGVMAFGWTPILLLCSWIKTSQKR